MRNIQLLSISLFIMSLSASEALSGLTTTYKCEDLGYTVPYDECVAINGTPLVCPFYSFEEKMTMCISRSCRGYDLTEDDLKTTASDSTAEASKTIRDHIKELEACCTGIDLNEDGDCNDENEFGTTYYKVMECKEGSLYTTTKNNNICEVGCLAARYPFKQHPGDLAGSVDICTDASATWYGYSDCNSGWVGGWNSTKATDNPTGRCELGACDIKEYPYSRDPNITKDGENINRGATLTCRIGSNTYYKYTNKDKDGNALTENYCGLSSDNNLKNYTLSLGACRGQCVFENCTSSLTEKELGGYKFSYNEFTCTQKTRDCRVGDIAVFEGVEAGIIVHLPESKYDENKEENDRLLISTLNKYYNNIEAGAENTHSSPLYKLSAQSSHGKYNSKFLLTYKAKLNEERPDNIKFNPEALILTNEYAPSGCKDIEVCKAGEWYIPSMEEAKYIYDNRYMLYNAVYEKDQNNKFSSGIAATSHEYYSGRYYVIRLSGKAWDGGLWDNGYGPFDYYRMMSIYVR